MSVLLEGTSVKEKVEALQKKVNRLEGEVARLNARLNAVERRQGISRPRSAGFDSKHVQDSEDVQCLVS